MGPVLEFVLLATSPGSPSTPLNNQPKQKPQRLPKPSQGLLGPPRAFKGSAFLGRSAPEPPNTSQDLPRPATGPGPLRPPGLRLPRGHRVWLPASLPASLNQPPSASQNFRTSARLLPRPPFCAFQGPGPSQQFQLQKVSGPAAKIRPRPATLELAPTR